MLPTINELANEVSRSNIKRERQLLIIKAVQDYYTGLAKVGAIKGAAAGLKEEDLELPNCKESCPYKDEIVDEAIEAAEKAEEEDGGAGEDAQDNDNSEDQEDVDENSSEKESENSAESDQSESDVGEESESDSGQGEQSSESEAKVEKPLAQMNKAELLSKCKELKIDADENLTNAKLVELIKAKL